MTIDELKAENARLKTEVHHLMVFCNCTLIPSKELQAQVERLTKAGDVMAQAYAQECMDERGGIGSVIETWLNGLESIKRWNAAKEGKQS